MSKPDIDGNPGNIQIEISNKVLDITDTTTSLLNRQRISEVYAQGATNIYVYSYADNCDKGHPAIIRVFIPSEAVRINKCLLSYKTEKFRAYERGTGIYNFGELETGFTDNTSWDVSDPGTSIVMTSEGDHDHDGNTGVTSGTGLPAHSHTITFELAHAHSLSPHKHTFTIPDHQHNIEYGIFEFEQMPASIIVKVDGNTIPNTELSENSLDITEYLKNTDGKINRGSFHIIEIYPVEDEINNPNGLARIEANVIVQCFIQSRGGGDF